MLSGTPLKCWNLERIIDAKLFGKDEPSVLSMEELLRENEGAVVEMTSDYFGRLNSTWLVIRCLMVCVTLTLTFLSLALLSFPNFNSGCSPPLGITYSRALEGISIHINFCITH